MHLTMPVCYTECIVALVSPPYRWLLGRLCHPQLMEKVIHAASFRRGEGPLGPWRHVMHVPGCRSRHKRCFRNNSGVFYQALSSSGTVSRSPRQLLAGTFLMVLMQMMFTVTGSRREVVMQWPARWHKSLPSPSSSRGYVTGRAEQTNIADIIFTELCTQPAQVNT